MKRLGFIVCLMSVGVSASESASDALKNLKWNDRSERFESVGFTRNIKGEDLSRILENGLNNLSNDELRTINDLTCLVDRARVSRLQQIVNELSRKNDKTPGAYTALIARAKERLCQLQENLADDESGGEIDFDNDNGSKVADSSATGIGLDDIGKQHTRAPWRLKLSRYWAYNLKGLGGKEKNHHMFCDAVAVPFEPADSDYAAMRDMRTILKNELFVPANIRSDAGRASLLYAYDRLYSMYRYCDSLVEDSFSNPQVSEEVRNNLSALRNDCRVTAEKYVNILNEEGIAYTQRQFEHTTALTNASNDDDDNAAEEPVRNNHTVLKGAVVVGGVVILDWMIRGKRSLVGCTIEKLKKFFGFSKEEEPETLEQLLEQAVDLTADSQDPNEEV